MKILIISGAGGGGAGYACFRLHTSLLKHGIDSKLLLLESQGQDLPASHGLYKSRIKLLFYKILNRFIFSRRQRLRNLPTGTESFFFPFSAFDIKKHPLYKWADVINLHWVSNIIDYPSFFKNNSKLVVWTIHDMEPFSGGYAYVKYFPFKAYQKFISKNESVKVRSLKNKKLTVVSPSKWLLEESMQSRVFQNFEHHLIPYGIDNKIVFTTRDQEYSRRLLGLPLESKIILFVASSLSNRRKGLDLLLKAVEKISDPNVALAIIGSGHADIYDHLSKVYLLGKIGDQRLMSTAYSASDLYVISSIEDNLPNTVIESLSCGTPVVGFKVGGIPDMVTPELNGFLAEDTDDASLYQAISHALHFSFNRGQIRKDAINRFHEDVQAELYIDLFKKLIAGRDIKGARSN